MRVVLLKCALCVLCVLYVMQVVCVACVVCVVCVVYVLCTSVCIVCVLYVLCNSVCTLDIQVCVRMSCMVLKVYSKEVSTQKLLKKHAFPLLWSKNSNLHSQY